MDFSLQIIFLCEIKRTFNVNKILNVHEKYKAIEIYVKTTCVMNNYGLNTKKSKTQKEQLDWFTYLRNTLWKYLIYLYWTTLWFNVMCLINKKKVYIFDFYCSVSKQNLSFRLKSPNILILNYGEQLLQKVFN